MITEEHLKIYRTHILEAAAKAHIAIKEAETVARSVLCEGCSYCEALVRHKIVLQTTVSDLLQIVAQTHPGTKAEQVFPKKMFSGYTLYRGFITDTGEYLDLPTLNHETFRNVYSMEYGKERGYRMITIHSSLLRNEVEFVDRKNPPTLPQLVTLQNLLIEAEGSLFFRFSYDSNHPR